MSHKPRTRGFALALLWLSSATSAAAQTPTPGVTVGWENGALVAEFTLPVGMHQSLQPDYFGVDIDPNDLPEGTRVDPAVFPKAPDTIAGLPSYTGGVTVKTPIQVTPGPASVELKGTVKWQLCYDDGVCLLPQRRPFTLTLTPDGQDWKETSVVVSTLEEGGPLEPSVLSRALPESAAGIPRPPTSAPDFWTLMAALGLAFVGGLILNLMPCVLPVLSLKALSLIKLADGDSGVRRAHAWATVGGILSSLLVLAFALIGLQAVGVTVGWGVQFQNPWYILAVLVVVWVFALSLFDVYTLPAPNVAPAVSRPGRTRGLVGSFFSGLLTVVLATPCTAPFLGTAVGLAFSSPWWVLVLVFLFIGWGLSLPFLVLTVTPALNQWLPKPGAWMGPFKGILGFALVATAVWLLTLLVTPWPASFAHVLWFLVLTTFVLWAWGALQRSEGTAGLRWLTRGVLVLSVVVGAALLLPWSAQPRGVAGQATIKPLPKPWQVFDESRIASVLKSGATVFLDVTADWCLTCKVNEAGALTSAQVLDAFRAKGVAAFRGDYTFADPILARWLARYSRAGVPFYLVLHPDGRFDVLPEVLTPELVVAALD